MHQAFSSLSTSACEATRADVVYGYQEKRSGAAARKTLGDLFWRVFNLMSPTAVPRNICTERLMSRRYVDALLTMGDRNLFLAGMYFWVGFEQVGVPLQRKLREGRTTYRSLPARSAHGACDQRLFELAAAGVVLDWSRDCADVHGVRVWLVVQKLLHPEAVF